MPGPRPAAAADGYLTDDASHPPPSSGPYAYYSTYGTFGPDQSGFPAVGETFVDPVFGSTIMRLTNELGKSSYSEIYAKNGFQNADGTLMHHRAPGARTIIDTRTGQVVRTGVPGNFDSSFAPDDPDAWYWFSWGSTALNKYKVSTGTSTVVKNFSEPFGQFGGSVDWIDGSGQYMALRLGGNVRVYDVKNDILYSGSIPGTYAAGGSWLAMSPDANFVVTAADSWKHYSFKIDHTNKSVSTSPVMFWSLCGDHADLVSASNGKTYMVTHECHSVGALYAVDVSLAQSTSDLAKQRSDNKKLVQLSSWSDVAGHFSGVSKGALRDWFFTSVNSGDDGFTSPVSPWRSYKAEILMINVLTGEVRRLAHHRSRSISSNYYYTPRVSASFDGSVVTWASNFGYSAGGSYVDIYAMRINGAGETTPPPPPPPPPPPTPTPVSVTFSNPADAASVSGTVTVTAAATGGSGSGYTYTVKAGTATIYNGTNATFSWNTSGTPNGSVTLTSTAVDSVGASGSATRTVTVNNVVTPPPPPPPVADTTAPTAKITSPNTNVWTGNSIEIKASATDDKALSKIELWGAGKAFATLPCTGTSCAGAYRWTTGTLAKGAYEVHAVAIDAAGNKTLSSPIVINKDATSPKVASGATGGTSTPPPPPPPPPAPLTVAFTSPAAGATVSGTVNFAIAVTGASGSLTVAPKLDGTVLPSQTVSGTTASISVNTTTVANGSHTVAVTVTDGAGKTATASLTFTVSNVVADTTAPTATITKPTGTVWTGNSINVAAAATDNKALSKIELWGAGKVFATIPCSGTSCSGSTWWLTGSLPKGAYIVNAVAVDAAGNRKISASVTIIKDAKTPTYASGAK